MVTSKVGGLPRVVHVSYHDSRHGAARAVERLRDGLRLEGLPTDLVVQVAFSRPRPDDVHGLQPPLAYARLVLDRVLLRARSLGWRIPAGALFSTQPLPDRALRRVRGLCPDLVHLHWLADGFGRVETLARVRAPIVWTLHDMWPFTGGCHYDGGCGRHRERCGCCPMLGSSRERDASRRHWERKRKSFGALNLTLVAPSRWIAREAAASGLLAGFDVRTIPYGLNSEVFHPVERSEARDFLDLPGDRQIVAFGAVHATTDRRKGLDLLLAALERLRSLVHTPPLLLLFGADRNEAPIASGYETRVFPRIGDDDLLARMLSAADVAVVPSREDNLPNLVMEAMACGVPCLGFDVGGIGDMIEHRKNGYLARPLDTDDLAAGLEWILGDPLTAEHLGSSCREKVLREFDLRLQARRIRSLYDELLSRARR